MSSWARPPPGTSCRKSLRRQKSRRGLVLLKHCSTAFRKHWGSTGTLPLPFQSGVQPALRRGQCSPVCLPQTRRLAPPPTSFHTPFTEERTGKWLLLYFPDFGGQHDQSPEAGCDEPRRSEYSHFLGGTFNSMLLNVCLPHPIRETLLPSLVLLPHWS